MNFQPTITQNLPKEAIDWLETRFFSLCDDETIWNEIKEKYNEKHRTYHNLSHIYSLFQLFDEANFTQNNPTLEWSIWYHDIIYDAKRKDNEKQSAVLFQKSCKSLLDSELIQAVSTVIESTAKHFPLSEAKEVKWMLDLDLFILCSPAAVYASYSKAIRQEYKWVPGILYKKGRKKVLIDSDALAIITEWSVFRTPSFKVMKELLKQPIIFDGRNLYDLKRMKEKGFYYESIGRDIMKSEVTV